MFMLGKAAEKVGFEAHLFHYKDICVFISNGVLDLRVGEISLKDFSAVFCRGFWDFQQEVSMLAAFCVKNGITLFDSALYSRQFISKVYDLLCFQLNDLPVPKTMFLDQGLKDENIICGELNFPIVAKENRSRMGYDVFLLKNRNELHRFLEKIDRVKKTLASSTYQFQEYIPADFDMRIIVLGGKVLGAIERRSTDANEFRHNISLGGKAKKINVLPELKRMAVKAATCLNYEFGGVDVITHRETGKHYVLEVNRSPAFGGFMEATNIDVPLKLMKFFLRFLDKNIK